MVTGVDGVTATAAALSRTRTLRACVRRGGGEASSRCADLGSANGEQEDGGVR